MALPKFEKDILIISKLADEPNDVGGLSAEELKSKFDEGASLIKDYINEELLPKVESDIEAAALGITSGGGIGGDTLRDGSITGEKLANGSIGKGKLAMGAVESDNIADSSINVFKLADSCVTEKKLSNGAVTGKKIAADSINADHIFTGAVVNDKIATNAVTADKIASGAVSTVYYVEVDGVSGVAAPYSKTITVTGLPDSNRIIADLICSDDWATTEAEEEAFGKISKIIASEGAITVYSKEKIDIKLSLKLLVIHGEGLGGGSGGGGEGGGSASPEGVLLIDRTTGATRTLYLNDGKLTLA